MEVKTFWSAYDANVILRARVSPQSVDINRLTKLNLNSACAIVITSKCLKSGGCATCTPGLAGLGLRVSPSQPSVRRRGRFVTRTIPRGIRQVGGEGQTWPCPVLPIKAVICHRTDRTEMVLYHKWEAVS